MDGNLIIIRHCRFQKEEAKLIADAIKKKYPEKSVLRIESENFNDLKIDKI